MGVKIPYKYTKFRNCPRATFVSKHTHKPTSCFLLAVIASVVPLALGVVLYNANGHSSAGFVGGVSTVLLLVGFFIFLIGGIFIPKLSDRFEWAQKVAAKEIAKKLSTAEKAGE
ncbi:MAG: hypothetical protein SOY94_08915 [Candidatus Limiplasma sp.]|nr:hypothetical protein [Candidatus Limiplasma sp.]